MELELFLQHDEGAFQIICKGKSNFPVHLSQGSKFRKIWIPMDRHQPAQHKTKLTWNINGTLPTGPLKVSFL